MVTVNRQQPQNPESTELPELPLALANLTEKAAKIKFLFSDCDGVLTDGGVFYTAAGEFCKRFSLKDGMGVERLRTLAGIDVGIISGENSLPLKKRAEKLAITELYLGIKDKSQALRVIARKLGLATAEIAYIGDDVNDLEVLDLVGFSACPADAFPLVKEQVDYTCRLNGGYGAFREVCEMIISLKNKEQ